MKINGATTLNLMRRGVSPHQSISKPKGRAAARKARKVQRSPSQAPAELLTHSAAAARDARDAEPVRIVVVDDHRFMRELISAMLARQGGRYNVVAERGDATTALQACKELSPDLLILDINLPDLSGIDAVPEIRKLAPKTRILLCTAFVTDDRVVDALRSGADGFVEKTNTWNDFVEAIDRVSRGEHYFRAQSCPALTGAAQDKQQHEHFAPTIPLSHRENEVLTLIAQGHTTKEIGTKLGVSIGTIESHRTNLMRKLKVRNVAGLVVHAFRAGLIRIGSGE